MYYLRSATFNPPSLHFCHLCTRILLTFPNSHKVFQHYSVIFFETQVCTLIPSPTLFCKIVQNSKIATKLPTQISKYPQSLSVQANSVNIFLQIRTETKFMQPDLQLKCPQSLSVQASASGQISGEIFHICELPLNS